MDPIVITMDTKLNEDGIRFLKSMTTNGWKYRLIGTDEKWVSFLHRAGMYLVELKEISDKDPNRLCVISDCRDVLCMRSPHAFTDAFKSFNSGIVVSCEIFCGGLPDPVPDTNCTDSSPYWIAKGYAVEDFPDRRYVNAGLVSGTAESLLHMYHWMVETGVRENIGDDQVLMGRYINEHPNLVAFDLEAEMLHTSTFGPSCGYLSSFQPYDSPSIAEILGRGAFFLHIPGASMGTGNSVVYDMVSLLVDKGYSSHTLLDLYKTNEFPWKNYTYPSKKGG